MPQFDNKTNTVILPLARHTIFVNLQLIYKCSLRSDSREHLPFVSFRYHGLDPKLIRVVSSKRNLARWVTAEKTERSLSSITTTTTNTLLPRNLPENIKAKNKYHRKHPRSDQLWGPHRTLSNMYLGCISRGKSLPAQRRPVTSTWLEDTEWIMYCIPTACPMDFKTWSLSQGSTLPHWEKKMF